jgi:hypothetical protein
MVKDPKFKAYYTSVYTKPDLLKQMDLVRGEYSRSQYYRVAVKRQIAEDMQRLKFKLTEKERKQRDG